MYVKAFNRVFFLKRLQYCPGVFNNDNHLSYWSTVCKPEVYFLLLKTESLDNKILEL